MSDDKRTPRRSHFFDISPPQPPFTTLPNTADYPPRFESGLERAVREQTEVNKALLAQKERELQSQERPKELRAPALQPELLTGANPASASKPPVPERDPVWEERVKPGIEDHVKCAGPFDNRTRLVEWVIDDLKVGRSKETIVRWVAPYKGKWFTLNGPRRKRKVASGPSATLRR